MKHIDIVFDRAPGPDSPRFIEVENDEGRSISAGNWLKRDDGHWVLRITPEQLKVLLGLSADRMDPEFTGTALHKLVIDIETAVGKNNAGATPLGAAVTELAERAYRSEDADNKQASGGGH